MPVGNGGKVVRPDAGECGPFEVGEVIVRGDNVMREYYKNPQETAKAFTPDGWLHTGDLGYVDAEGYFFITGRLKELIIKGGENIAPREIDDVLYKHPAVLEAAAVGIPDRHYGQDIFAGVVLKPGAALWAFLIARRIPWRLPPAERSRSLALGALRNSSQRQMTGKLSQALQIVRGGEAVYER